MVTDGKQGVRLLVVYQPDAALAIKLSVFLDNNLSFRIVLRLVKAIDDITEGSGGAFFDRFDDFLDGSGIRFVFRDIVGPEHRLEFAAKPGPHAQPLRRRQRWGFDAHGRHRS